MAGPVTKASLTISAAALPETHPTTQSAKSTPNRKAATKDSNGSQSSSSSPSKLSLAKKKLRKNKKKSKKQSKSNSSSPVASPSPSPAPSTPTSLAQRLRVTASSNSHNKLSNNNDPRTSSPLLSSPVSRRSSRRIAIRKSNEGLEAKKASSFNDPDSDVEMASANSSPTRGKSRSKRKKSEALEITEKTTLAPAKSPKSKKASAAPIDKQDMVAIEPETDKDVNKEEVKLLKHTQVIQSKEGQPQQVQQKQQEHQQESEQTSKQPQKPNLPDSPDSPQDTDQRISPPKQDKQPSSNNSEIKNKELSPLKSQLPSPAKQNVNVSPKSRKKVAFCKELETGSTSPSKHNTPLRSILKVNDLNRLEYKEAPKLNSKANPLFPQQEHQRGSENNDQGQFNEREESPFYSRPKNLDLNAVTWSQTNYWTKQDFENSGSESYQVPYNIDFWQPGTIVQLEKNSITNYFLVDGGLSLLRDELCPRKFEIYASINYVLHSNSHHFIARKLIDINDALVKCVVRDITASGEKITKKVLDALKKSSDPNLSPAKASDPFESRVVTQAMKLFIYYISKLDLVSSLNPDSMIELVNYICDKLIKDGRNLPKSIASIFLSCLKDQKLSKFQKMSLTVQKKYYDLIINNDSVTVPFSPLGITVWKEKQPKYESKKYFISLESSERMLRALTKLRSYNSFSIALERLIAIRNFIQEFPAVMAKNFKSWSYYVFLYTVSAYKLKTVCSKVLDVVNLVFLELVKVFVNNNVFKVKMRLYLNNTMVRFDDGEQLLNLESVNENDETFDTLRTQPSDKRLPLLDQIICCLRESIKLGESEQLMDIWLAITLLMNNGPDMGFPKFEITKWDMLEDWLSVFKVAIASGKNAPQNALLSWRCFIFITSRSIINSLQLKKSTEYVAKNNGATDESIVSQFVEENQKKFDLLLYPFTKLEFTKKTNELELSPYLHSITVTTVYSLFTKLSLESDRVGALTYAMYAALWNKIVTPIFQNFYLARKFKHFLDQCPIHKSGMTLISQLLGGSPSINPPVSVASPDMMEILSSEPIKISRLKPLPSKWVWLQATEVSKVLFTLFGDQVIPESHKFDLVLLYLACLKDASRKEKDISLTYKNAKKGALNLILYFFNTGTITPASKNAELFPYALNAFADFLDIFKAEQIEIEDLETVNAILDALASMDTKSGSSHLKVLMNAVSTSKQLKLFESVAHCRQESITKFVANNLESRIYSDFSLFDFETLGNIICGDYENSNLDVRAIALNLCLHLVRKTRLAEPRKVAILYALNLWRLKSLDTFLDVMFYLRFAKSCKFENYVCDAITAKFEADKNGPVSLHIVAKLLSAQWVPKQLQNWIQAILVHNAKLPGNEEGGQKYNGSVNLYRRILELLFKESDAESLNAYLLFGLRDATLTSLAREFVKEYDYKLDAESACAAVAHDRTDNRGDALTQVPETQTLGESTKEQETQKGIVAENAAILELKPNGTNEKPAKVRDHYVQVEETVPGMPEPKKQAAQSPDPQSPKTAVKDSDKKRRAEGELELAAYSKKQQKQERAPEEVVAEQQAALTEQHYDDVVEADIDDATLNQSVSSVQKTVPDIGVKVESEVTAISSKKESRKTTPRASPNNNKKALSSPKGAQSPSKKKGRMPSPESQDTQIAKSESTGSNIPDIPQPLSGSTKVQSKPGETRSPVSPPATSLGHLASPAQAQPKTATQLAETILESDEDDYFIDASENPQAGALDHVAPIPSPSKRTRAFREREEESHDTKRRVEKEEAEREIKRAKKSSILDSVSAFFGAVKDEDLGSMSVEDKFELEGSLLQFMTRMRSKK